MSVETASGRGRSSHPAALRSGVDRRETGSRPSLLARLKAGDGGALAEIVEEHWVGCVRYARRLLGRPGSTDLAEDMAQEAFVRLWEHRDRWKPDTPPHPLVLRILRNLILNEERRLRITRKWARQVGASQRRPNPTPDDHLTMEQVRERARRAVDELPPRQREVYLLVRQEGLTYREVAGFAGPTW